MHIKIIAINYMLGLSLRNTRIDAIKALLIMKNAW
jgi:hypothetical protein